MLIVEPVVSRPWLAEWKAEKIEIAAELERGSRQVTRHPHEAAKRGRAAVPGVPRSIGLAGRQEPVCPTCFDPPDLASLIQVGDHIRDSTTVLFADQSLDRGL